MTPKDIPGLTAHYKADARFGVARGWRGEAVLINLADRFVMLRWLYWTVRLRLGMRKPPVVSRGRVRRDG